MSLPTPTLSPSELEAAAMAGSPAPVSAKRSGRGWLERISGGLVTFSHCRIELPAFRFAGRGDPLSRVHRLALALDEERPPAPGAVRRRLATALHALNALRQALVFGRRYGGFVARHRGLSRRRQLAAAWSCQFHHNQLPRHYYERHLFAEPDRRRWLEHLEHRELTVLLRALNRRVPQHRISNKFLFAEHCRRHGLPVPPTLAAWSATGDGLVVPADLPAADLFAKPFADYGGVGAIVVPWSAADARYAWAGERLSSGGLIQALARQAPGRGILLQPRLRNAAALAERFGDDDLTNLRLVTGRPPDGPPRLLAAGLRMPSRFTTVGHDRHVLMAPVALADGRLGAAHVRGRCGEGWTRHPDTGAALAGVVLPRWREMADLALAAHDTCPWMPFVGWDLIDTDRGVLLLEANTYWGANVVQVPGGVPLGSSEFPALYLAWHCHLGLATLPEV